MSALTFQYIHFLFSLNDGCFAIYLLAEMPGFIPVVDALTHMVAVCSEEGVAVRALDGGSVALNGVGAHLEDTMACVEQGEILYCNYHKILTRLRLFFRMKRLLSLKSSL